MNRDKSHAVFSRARELMPGGVNSPARAFGAVGREPIVFARGEGAWPFASSLRPARRQSPSR